MFVEGLVCGCSRVWGKIVKVMLSVVFGLVRFILVIGCYFIFRT